MRANESLIIRRVAEPSAPTSRGVSVYVRTAIVGKALYDGRTTLRDMNLAAL